MQSDFQKRAEELYQTGAADGFRSGFVNVLKQALEDAALSTDAEPVTGRNDEAGYVEFLNEDVPYVVRDIEGRCAILVDLHTRKYIGYRVYDPDSDFGSHAANAEPVKTAPAVAVKALEWRDEPVPPSGETLAPSVVGLYCIPHSGDRFYLRFRDAITLGDYSTLDKAKSAAQSHYEARILSALSAQVQGVEETLETYYQRQIEWSRETFGPALRTKGIIDHITKELREIEADPHDLSEWVDVVILAMDGFWRHGGSAEDLFKALIAKQKKNMARSWPDWRTMSEDSAIEHDRSKDAASPASKHGDAE